MHGDIMPVHPMETSPLNFRTHLLVRPTWFCPSRTQSSTTHTPCLQPHTVKEWQSQLDNVWCQASTGTIVEESPTARGSVCLSQTQGLRPTPASIAVKVHHTFSQSVKVQTLHRGWDSANAPTVINEDHCPSNRQPPGSH